MYMKNRDNESLVIIELVINLLIIITRLYLCQFD